MKPCSLLLLCLGLGLLGGPVVAQSTSAPPQFFIRWNAAPVFPQGMYFELEAVVPEDVGITFLTLTLEADNRDPVQVRVPTTDETLVTREQERLTVEYIWLFQTADVVPELFSTVRYEWSMGTTTSDRTDVGAGEVVFEDQRVFWRRTTDDTLGVTLLHPQEGVDGERVLSIVDDAWRLMEANTAPIGERTVLFYTEGLPMGCLTTESGNPVAANLDFDISIPCEPTIIEAVYERTRLIVFDEVTGSRDAADRVLVWAVDEFYRDLWAEADAPRWFRAGLTELYRPIKTQGVLSATLLAARSGDLLSLDALTTPPDAPPPMFELWQAQSYGLVIYMAERHGLDAVYELAGTVGDYESFQMAYEAITGESLSALYVAWEAWLFSDEAVRVYNVDIYGRPTLTPTRVLSDTPTWTPLPTLTATLTPTITLTPTVTLTPTPLPPTVTVTPRSARDVFTATPTPTPDPVAQVASQPTTRYALYGLAGLAVSILLLGVLLSSRR